MFLMNEKLAGDTLFIGEFPLCSVMLMNNRLYPWIILVPKRNGAKEIIDLSKDDRAILIEEIASASDVMKNVYWPDKLNIAAIGNIVEQLHIHIISRFKTDDSWPEPVWGKGSEPYTEQGKRESVTILRREFSKAKDFVPVANNP